MIRYAGAALSALALSPCAYAQASTSSAETTLQTVIVTGRSAEPERKVLAAEQARTPGAVSIVDGEDLRQRSVTSLADMLRYVPGLWVTSGATAGSTFFSSRGSNLDAINYDGNGIKMLVDGLPVTAADGNNHNRDVDPLSARYAVVARGANALTYGASTLGGAIDFITPTARDGAPNEIFLSAGSHGQRQGRLTVGTVAGAFDGLLTVEGRRFDGFRRHQEQERTGFYANAGWQFAPNLRTRFYATAIDNDQELPGVLTRSEFRANRRQAEPAAVAGNYQYNVKTWRLANKTVWDIDAESSFSAGVSFESQKLYHPIVYAPPFFSLLIDTEQRNLGTALRYQRRMGDHDLLVGVNWGRTTVEGGNYSYQPGGTRTRFADVNNHANSLEVFVMDRWQFAPQWTAVYGGQGTRGQREVRGDNLDGTFHSFNPRAGLIYQLTPATQLFANVSRTYEAPTLYELQDDTKLGPKPTLLDAMKGVVVEVGTRGALDAGSSRWHWDVALYWGRLKNEILSRDNLLAPGTSQAFNVDHTIHAGAEALLGASFELDAAGAHRIEPLLNLTVNHFRFDGDTTYGHNRLPAAPNYALKGEVLYRHASGFFAGPTFDRVGRRWADFANTYRVSGYTLWGLRAGYTTPRWEVFVDARNLSDKAYVSQFSVKDEAAAGARILQPGEDRSVYVGVRLKF